MLNFAISNIICIDTIFLHSYFDFKFFNNNIRQNFNIYQSKYDSIYNPQFQDYCYDMIKNYNNTIDKKKFNTTHCENMDIISKFITSYL